MQASSRPANESKTVAITLSIVAGPYVGESRTFHEHGTLVVGRAADCQWCLKKDLAVSRYHSSIQINPPEAVLNDLDSGNGTYLNGDRICEATLNNGDEIRCGDTTIGVAIHAAASACTPNSFGPKSELGTTTEFRRPVLPPLDTHFANYRINRELGRGAMGVVYHATHALHKRDVALKVILPSAAARPESVQMFLREAGLLNQLRHRRIVECLEVGLHDGQMYFVMEYVPTIDFLKVLGEQPFGIRVRVACGIVCRGLEALRYAHENDVVHRDVKPSNVLVYRRENRLSAKLADFGLAKNYAHAGLSEISRDGEVKGTLPYMAPEQLIDCRYAKPPCDIYGAGACLYYYLTGTTPHDLDGSRSAVARILNTEPVPIRARLPRISETLAAIVRRAMAREPADRFSSAEHMRKALLPFAKPSRGK